MTTTDIEALARRLAQCATVGRFLDISTGRTNSETPAVCVSPGDTEAILGHLDNLDRQIVLDRSADIVAAEMGGRTER